MACVAFMLEQIEIPTKHFKAYQKFSLPKLRELLENSPIEPVVEKNMATTKVINSSFQDERLSNAMQHGNGLK